MLLLFQCKNTLHKPTKRTIQSKPPFNNLSLWKNVLLLPLLLILCHDEIHADANLEEEYPMAMHCTIYKSTFHNPNSTIFEFDILQTTVIEEEEEVSVSATTATKLKEEETDAENIKLKIEFLIHTRDEYNTLMRNTLEFHQCTVDISKTYKFHIDAKEASSSSGTMSLMNTDSTSASSSNSYETISENYNCFRSINGIYETMMDLNATYYAQDLVRLDKIGESYLKTIRNGGDDLLVLKVSNFSLKDAQKSHVFLTFGIHAREYAPPELGMRYIEYILQRHNIEADVQTLIDTTILHFLLYSNPDGRRIAEEEPQLYVRKNRNRSYRNCTDGRYGIDLNRNFPFEWGGLGASSSACSETFRGPASKSEPETQAIVDYASKIFPSNQGRASQESPMKSKLDPYPLTNTGIYLDIHSYGQLNIYPWSFENLNTPNSKSYIALATKLSYHNKHKLAGPLTKEYLYEAAGDTTDYMYGALGVLSFTLEVGNTFYERCSVFEQKYLPDNLKGLLYISRLASRPYSLPFGPDVISIDYDLTTPSDTATPSSTYYLCISATISDKTYATYAQTGITYMTGIQTVASAFVIIDEYPHHHHDTTIAKDYTSYPLIRNSKQEDDWNIVLPFEKGSLSFGKHIFHIYAIDSSADIGPISSKFFYVCEDGNDTSCPTTPTTNEDTTYIPKACNTMPCGLHKTKELCALKSNVRRCAWDDGTEKCRFFPRRRRYQYYNARNRKGKNRVDER